MRVTALILLLASVAAPFAHRECTLNHREHAAAERHHAPHPSSHAPSHQHDAPAECTMVGSCATVAAPPSGAMIAQPVWVTELTTAALPHAYRNPQLTRLKPPPRFIA